MRAFIAFELSENVRKELSRLQTELKNCGADVKWVAPANIHLTLKFLGDIDEEKAEKIKAALKDIAGRNKNFEISLFKLGAFPKLDYPRVIWAGVDRGCARCEQIASAIEDGLEKIGFARESRPFSAHLTIGRVKSAKNKAVLKQKLLSLEINPLTCPVSGITLFKSTLSPSGPTYTQMGTFLLAASS